MSITRLVGRGAAQENGGRVICIPLRRPCRRLGKRTLIRNILQYALSCSDVAVGMARLAMLGVLSLALLALKVSAQLGSGLNETMLDDADYEDLLYSGDHFDRPCPPEWIEPVVPPDPTWRNDLCLRYRNGTVL